MSMNSRKTRMWQESREENRKEKQNHFMRRERKRIKLTSEVVDVDVAVDELASFVPDTAASSLI